MGGKFSSLRGARVMERDVSGTRQRAFFQSICPASRPAVEGTGPIKKLGCSRAGTGRAPKILMNCCTVR